MGRSEEQPPPHCARAPLVNGSDGWLQECGLGLASGKWKGEGSEMFMRPDEARIGKRVRVRKDLRTTDLRGREGTIAKRWGTPGYPALDVSLDDGGWQLFWYHELEPLDEKGRSVHDAQAGPARGCRHEARPTQR
jgi:hypothetical protein